MKGWFPVVGLVILGAGFMIAVLVLLVGDGRKSRESEQNEEFKEGGGL